MTVLASTIIDRVRTQLIDTGDSPRWSDTELLRHLSDGQRTLAAVIPSAASHRTAVQLATGTRQALPSDGQMLLSVTRNMGTSGTTPGRAIRLVMREILDTQNPNWHADYAQRDVHNYTYDPSDPQGYHVYPPSNGQGYVEINYARVPPELTSLTDALSVQDIYQTPLLDYVMFRAHQKDSDYAGGGGIGASYLQAFNAFLQGRMGGQGEENPNLQLMPFNPQAKGAAK